MNLFCEVYSWTSSPACVWLVRLLTVPRTVTVAPGAAYAGFIASMVTDTPLVPAWCTGAGLVHGAGLGRTGQRQPGGDHGRGHGQSRGQGQGPPLDLRR